MGVVGREEPLTVHTVLGDERTASAAWFGELRSRHEEFFRLYRAGEIAAASRACDRAARAALAAQAAQAAPDGLAKLYALYARRLRTFERDGLPDPWDGVFRAASK